MRLRIKLILLIVVLTVASGGTVALLASNIMYNALEEQMEKRGVVIAQTLADHATPNVIDGEVVAAREVLLETVQRTEGTEFAYIVGFDGNVFAHSFEDGFPRDLLPQKHYLIHADNPRLERYATEEGFGLLVGYPLIDGMKAHLHIGLNASSLYNQVESTRNQIIGATFIAALLAVLFGTVLSRSITRPLEQLSESMRVFGGKGVKQELDLRGGGREVTELTRSFNQMTENLTKITASRDELDREVTERKRAEEELTKHREHLEELVKKRTAELEKKTIDLEQANIDLQEMDRLKSVFLASMSHELRTPLNSIIGFTGIILQGMAGDVNEEQRKQLTMVKNSASHLLSLIDDVLDISKIEEGRLKLSLEEFGLNDVASEVVETLSSTASEKGLDLLTEVPEGITLFTDRRRIKQVLMNLGSNAVKFTDQGNVTIAARVPGDENLEVRVTDTGIGIKKEHMDKLFQPFQRIGMSLTKSYTEGTGLGLYLTKKVIDLLGGDISAKSEYGRGSEFTFTLPLKYEEGQGNEEDTGS